MLLLKTASCFNIEPVAWKSWSHTHAGFGYQVVQRKSDVLVSAPLQQSSQNRRGEIYKCSISNRDCQNMRVSVPDFAVNMSLGLTMTRSPATQSTLACGPTIPKDCSSITMYNGVCVEITRNDGVQPAVPDSLEECRASADIAFLLDGSGSVASRDFSRMKSFVKSLVSSFTGRDTQFAVAQFSRNPTVHYYFNNFFTSGSWEVNIDKIKQVGGGTHTAKAIKFVVNDIFTSTRGSRSNVKKILIVITDGESNDHNDLGSAASLAARNNIVRFAIGVGGAFNKPSAKGELDTIASYPPRDYVFQVENFNALDKIKQNLQDKIFSIEGSQSGGESLKMEMAQAGFSAAFVSGGIQMGMVGANQWRGGYMSYKTGLRPFEPMSMLPDSYLGYSMTVANTQRGILTVLGAPRYNHIGIVIAVDAEQNPQKINPFLWHFQSGEYFGAEVCAMDVDGDSFTDLILISAPMYKEDDREGRVYVCILTGLVSVDCRLDSPEILRGAASDKGRFGSSLAVLPDLNRDSLMDLAVGAPLENDGQGSIYIFLGERGGINDTYSQRITASEVQTGLKFFGTSISQFSFDQTGDSLPDLAVGSKGTVVLLRSKPIVTVAAALTFSPKIIPTQNTDCERPLPGTASICFTMTKHSPVNTAEARINYTLTLDITRKPPGNRAYLADKTQEGAGSVILDLTETTCSTMHFSMDACPEDALNILSNELKFTFEGLPSITNLKPSLSRQAQTTNIYPLGFEINCGTDNKCVDDLRIDFNFTSSSEVKVGIDELLNVTVSLQNRGENSYNTRVALTYPARLSYRKFTSLKGRIECNSFDSEDGLSQGKTDCTIDKPIFKSNTNVLFIVSYGIKTDAQLERTIYVTANATSGNEFHSSSNKLYQARAIDVKYSIFITVESTLSYNNFTYGKNDLQKPLKQSILVTNDIRALEFTVMIRVPIKLGDKDIWVDSNNLERVTQANVTDFVAQIQKTKVVDCSVASCAVFNCTKFMGRLEKKVYRISANISSQWIEQIGLSSAKFLLTSTATVEYDRNQYIFFSTVSNNNPPIRKIEAEIEVYPEPDFTKEIVGGSLGGLALLLLLTAGLYKAGFFKSKYKQMMNESGEQGAGPEADEGGITQQG
uniref:Integrin alpha-M-like n=1 Tax=Echeneis naucrates TaxID=173247 RepID=A0A665UIS3_ECHNA